MAQKSLIQELAHVLVLVILLIVLLVVVTKFKVVHPSAIPGWQGVYCTYIEQKHSMIGLVHGTDGAGDPEELRILLSNMRPNMRVEPVQLTDATPALLSRFEVIILERSKTVSFKSLSALEGYLDAGGSIIWTGDALSNQVLDERDLEEARNYNSSHPNWFSQTGKDYYAWFTETYSTQQGFGEFGNKFLGGYLRSERATSATTFTPVIRDHLVLSGIRIFPLKAGASVSVVNQNDDVNLLARIDHGQQTFPALLEKKYVGKIIYAAFPLESIESQSLVNNLFDYLVTC